MRMMKRFSSKPIRQKQVLRIKSHCYDDGEGDRRGNQGAAPLPAECRTDQKKNEVDEKRAGRSLGKEHENGKNDQVDDMRGDMDQTAEGGAAQTGNAEKEGISRVTGENLIGCLGESGRFGGVDPDGEKKEQGQQSTAVRNQSVGGPEVKMNLLPEPASHFFPIP